ncbi:MAG: T9SS type A sorting domain-containing protein [Chitinophagaceae bacterium]|nr:T9SS type A sorting domain-containing protein [Chitinophagaceae bacterium]
MKKFLLFVTIACSYQFGFGQTVLNELYTEPGNNNEEFIELYNSSTVGSQNVNCFTILTYWESGSNKGWYVLDLPDATLGPKGFYVLASADPFTTQSTPNPGVSPNVNWNDANFRNGSTGGYLKKWQVSGGGYTDVSGTIPANLNDFMESHQFNGPTYITLVFVNGVFNNGFIGGGATGNLPASVAAMPDLPVDMAGACSDFTVDFSTLGAMEFVNASPGNDNGYARTSDGKCGSWAKTAPGVSHTPGVTNGSAAGLSGALTTSQLLQCNTGPGVSTVTYNITGVSGSATEADDFPVEVQLYIDNGTPGQLDGADVYQESLFDNTIADPAKQFTIPQTANVILVYKTKRGCFDKVFAIANGCLPLPANFGSFTAKRSAANVQLKWETLTEQNSKGFSVERNTGDNNWIQVAYVPSQAANGSSNDILIYQYTDVNTYRGISQYRIRQIDLDNKSKFSEIRSVRGEGQPVKTIVYPNPSTNGTVNIAFEEKNSILDVSLSDMNGRIIQSWYNVNNNLQVNNLLPGVYALRIVDRETGEQSTEKIVVSK